MYYVYLLKSSKNKDVYVGYTENLKQRFIQHNQGRVKSTKANKPWILVYYEAYKNKKDATRREKQLKKHRVKNEVLSRVRESLKI
ncbi:MAG: GIY-YIG nuclease family protein [Microgenomates group bacterium]